MQLSKGLAVLCLYAYGAACFATDHIFGPGASFPIVERDALEEIEERAAKADVEEYVNKTPRSEWSAWSGYRLPVAKESRTRGFVPWYTLEFDITGPSGEVLYPKGFTFNPLQHVKHQQRIVIFKLDQLERIEPLLKPGDMLIADEGDVVAAAEKSGHHIYILNEKLANRLGVKVAPSIVEQKGTHFEIREVELEKR